MTNEEIRNAIQKAIDEERVMLFMKGTPDAPRCGFSARVTAMLNALEVEYAALDILPDPRIREELSAISSWRLRHRDRDVRVGRARAAGGSGAAG
jgi:monothiol glutaredoxin